MPTTLTYNFCTVTMHNSYMIVVMNAGVHITPEHNEVLENLAERFFKDKPFVYLTHRKHSYSVDPAIYKLTSQIKNLAGFGVVADVPVAKANAEVEKLFLNKPFEIFTDLKEAESWALSILDNAQEQA